MNAKHTILSTIDALRQPKWIRPTLMALAFLVAVLGVSGCQPCH
jgi:hypothetical protein